ncbi:MAG: hypothetical protein QOI53_4429, partial [Verrucomicrobiota bacterium]|nr:hypothetical protein [Verrucomicrobiota bacterium]
SRSYRIVLAAIILATALPVHGSIDSSGSSNPQPKVTALEDREKLVHQKDYSKPRHSRLGKNLKDNAAIIGTIATIVAAIFAIYSFVLNYRTTIRNQQDTQFYEALKRLGDKDSPSVRSSAAGLLRQMIFSHQRYLRTTFYQLTASQSLEQNSVVADSIGDALEFLYLYKPSWCLGALLSLNSSLRHSFIRSLVSLLILRGASVGKPLPEGLLKETEFLGIYPRHLKDTLGKVLQGLAFSFLHHSIDLVGLPEEERGQRAPDVVQELRDTIKRLSLTIDAIGDAVSALDSEHHPIVQRIRHIIRKPKVCIEYCFLPNVNFNILGNHIRSHFFKSELQYADFRGAILAKSTFIDCRLDFANFKAANLKGAKMATLTLNGANLQGADLSGANLLDCSLCNADLTDTKLDLKEA